MCQEPNMAAAGSTAGQGTIERPPIAEVDDAELQRRLAEHRAKKAAMIAEEEKKHFSYDVKQ